MSESWVLKLFGPAELATPRPLLDIGLASRATGLSWKVLAKGGMGGATFRLPTARRGAAVGPLRDDPLVLLGGHVEVWRGSRCVYEGLVMDIELGNGGVPVEIECAGYAETLKDDVWTRTDLTDALTAGDVLRTALADRTPWLTPGVVGDQWIDPQVLHPGGMSDFQTMSVWQIADQVMQDGDSLGRQVWVMVMPGRKVWLLPRAAPPQPHYVMPFDSERITRWRVSRREMAATVLVEAGSGGSSSVTGAATTAGFAQRWGFAPRLVVQAGERTGAAADALRDQELTRRSQPTIRGTVMAGADPRTWLTTRHGTPAPYWQPLPGEWVRVAGYPALPIVAVSVDTTGGTATYELGARDPTLLSNMWIASREAIDRQRQMLAMTGGRLR